jgi:hypothetical protein
MLQNLTKTGHKTERRIILTRRREEERNLQPWRPPLKRREMNHKRRRGTGGTRWRAIKISVRGNELDQMGRGGRRQRHPAGRRRLGDHERAAW